MAFITLKDFYLRYPHKCYNLQSTTIPVPYVKKDDLDCDDKHTKTYQEYTEVVSTILDEIQNVLLEGNPYKMPLKMGTLQMFKYKTYRKYLFVKKKDGTAERRRSKSPHTGDHYPLLKWLRSNKDSYMWTKWHFSIKIMSNFSDKISKLLKTNPSAIFKYSDAIKKNYKALDKDEKLRSN